MGSQRENKRAVAENFVEGSLAAKILASHREPVEVD